MIVATALGNVSPSAASKALTAARAWSLSPAPQISGPGSFRARVEQTPGSLEEHKLCLLVMTRVRARSISTYDPPVFRSSSAEESRVWCAAGTRRIDPARRGA